MKKPLYKEKYPNLFNPLVVKRGNTELTFKNRVLVSPMIPAGTADGAGLPNFSFVDFFSGFAKGGFGGITLTCKTPYDANPDRGVTIEGEFLEPWIEWHKTQRLIHAYDAVSITELVEPLNMPAQNPKYTARSASPYDWNGVHIGEMTEDDIEQSIQNHVLWAQGAKRCGADSIMLHVAHGWTIHHFLSPLTNHRKDKFGGSVENRVRFLRMIIERIRKEAVGDMIIHLRMNGNDFTAGGITPEDAAAQIKCLEDLVDMVHISCGQRLDAITRVYQHPTHYVPPAHNAISTEIIKKAGVKIPIGVVGSVHDPVLAEQILAEGKADFVLMARQAVADPEWVNKVMYGKEEDIRPCLRCSRCLDGNRRGGLTKNLTFADKPTRDMHCAVNPFYAQGIWKKYLIEKPTESRNVAVVGGGIAGLQAALTAAQQGHKVTLFEKTDKLGGILYFSDHVWFKKEVAKYREYMILQVKKAGVNIRLNTEVDPEFIYKAGYDVAIIAIGAKPIIPSIPGIDGKNVVQALDIFGKEDKLGKNITIIGGGMSACEIAVHLMHLDGTRKISIIEMDHYLAANALFTERVHTMQYLEDYKVDQYIDTRCTEILPDGVKAINENGEELLIPADNIIVCVGMKSLKEEAQAYEDSAYIVKSIGDCKQVADISFAVDSGWNAAATII